MILKHLNILRSGGVFHKLSGRQLFAYVAIAFNRVDFDRLQLVGPDRLCAEWLIKNGGMVTTIQAPNRPIKDYNTLPPENSKFKIKTVDASGSSIMKIGLDHFKGCTHIDTVIFHQCKHLEEDGLGGLVHLKKTLKALQVSECDNIEEPGLAVIEEMSNLEQLRIFNMRYVEDIERVKTRLTKALPNCSMDISK